MVRNKLLKWKLAILEEPTHGERVRKFECSECGSEYGAIEKIEKNAVEYTKCPKCKQETLEVIILGVAHVSVKGNITTVGQLAEANTKKLGKYGKEEKDRQSEERHKAARNHVGLGDVEKAKRLAKINKMTPQQKQLYIHTGEGL